VNAVRRIAFVGNPNAGKSALINLLAGSALKTGNWPGVTVDKAEAEITHEGMRLRLTDLPGIYDLQPSKTDERIAVGSLLSEPPDLIVNVVDLTNLRRHLNLTLELTGLGRPLLVVLNFGDEAARHGMSVDTDALAHRLGVPVLTTTAVRPDSRTALLDALTRDIAVPGGQPALAAGERRTQVRQIYADCVRQATTKTAAPRDRADRWLLHPILGPVALLAALYLVFKLTFDLSGPLIDWSEGFVTDYLGGMLLSLVGVLHPPGWVVSLLADGVIAGVGLVVSFVPLLALLYLCIAVLEQSGYMARAAVLLDRLMQRVGLNGKAFIPMLLGFGCNVPAVYALRALDSDADRRATAAVLPFMSCGARLPIYMLFTTVFFERHQAGVILGLYLAGVAVALGWSLILMRRRPPGGDSALLLELPPYRNPFRPFLWRTVWWRVRGFLSGAGGVIALCMILIWTLTNLPYGAAPARTLLGGTAHAAAPVFRPLGLGDDWRPVAAVVPGFVAKEVVVGALGQLYAPAAADAAEPAEDLLRQTAAQSAGLIAAIGDAARAPFAGWVPGVFRTEPADDGIAAGVRSAFTPLTALVFMTFNLLLMPCVATMGALAQEFGRRFMLVTLGRTLITAYAAAAALYQIGRLLGY
jgi:ferrous iron transport protein B